MSKANRMHVDSSLASSPNGQPVILIHGLGSSKRDWDGLSLALRARGLAPVSLDLLGHGDSAKPDDPTQYHIAAIYAEFDKWLQTQRIPQSVSLVGHSLGGYLALKYALDHPDRVRALVLIDPFYKPDQLSGAMRSIHRRPNLASLVLQKTPNWLVRIVLSQVPKGAAQFSSEMRDRIASDLKRASPYILNVSATLPDLESELSNVSAPTLVVWGKGDLTLRPSTFHTLVDLMPNAVAHSFAGCGHQPHLAKAEVFSQLAADFLISPY